MHQEGDRVAVPDLLVSIAESAAGLLSGGDLALVKAVHSLLLGHHEEPRAALVLDDGVREQREGRRALPAVATGQS